jgi:argininosuccinate lyase
VEEVNRKVMQNTPFREAYREVGQAIAKGNFNPDKELKHTHEGSIGNLCTEQIREKFNEAFNN